MPCLERHSSQLLKTQLLKTQLLKTQLLKTQLLKTQLLKTQLLKTQCADTESKAAPMAELCFESDEGAMLHALALAQEWVGMG